MFARWCKHQTRHNVLFRYDGNDTLWVKVFDSDGDHMECCAESSSSDGDSYSSEDEARSSSANNDDGDSHDGSSDDDEVQEVKPRSYQSRA